MFLVHCKLIQSRKVASVGSIVLSKSARFSKGIQPHGSSCMLLGKLLAPMKYILCCHLGLLASTFGFQEMVGLTSTPAAH